MDRYHDPYAEAFGNWTFLRSAVDSGRTVKSKGSRRSTGEGNNDSFGLAEREYYYVQGTQIGCHCSSPK